MKTRLLHLPMMVAVFISGIFFTRGEDISTQARLPDDSRQTAQTAADQFKAGHFDAAAGLYQSILKAHPDSLYAWCNLGVVRFQAAQYDAARAAFLHALKLSPHDEFTKSDLALVNRQIEMEKAGKS